MSKESTGGGELPIGSRVVTGRNFDKHGTIKFIGETTFAEGTWIGICLDTPDGKNNGTHSGVEYFEAGENHGVFVKSWGQVKPEETVEAKPSRPTTRTSLIGKPSARPEAEAKPSASSSSSSSSLASANREKLAALRERRAQQAPPPTPKPAAPVPKIDVPATPRRPIAINNSSSRANGGEPSPVDGSGSLSSSSGFPSMSAEDLREMKSPGKDAALVEMMQVSIYKLTKQVDEKDDEITQYKAALESLTVEKKQQSARITELDSTLQSVTADKEELSAAVSQLENRLSDESAHKAESDRVLSELRGELESSRSQLSAASLQLQELVASSSQESLSEVLQRTIDELRAKDEESQATIAALTGSVAAAQHSSDEKETRLSAMDASMEALRSALQSAEEKLAAQASNTADVEAKNKADVAAVRAQLLDAQLKEQSLMGEVASLKSALAGAQEALGADAAQQSSATEMWQSQIDDLRRQLAASQETAAAQRVAEAALQVEVEELRAAVAELRQAADAAKAAASNAATDQQMTIDRLLGAEQALSRRIEALQQTVAEREAELLTLTTAHRDVEDREKSALEAITSLRSRLAAAEAQAADSAASADSASGEAVAELEEQLESLAMDKEALLLEKETLEERVRALEAETAELRTSHEMELLELMTEHEETLASYSGGGAVGAEGATELSASQLQSELHKVQAALCELQEAATEDKELVSTQAALLEELELECGELRAFKEEAVETIAELRAATDDVSGYGDMIEELTARNLELSAAVAESKRAISDLEEAVELNDELDARQAQQIDEDRRTIDSLNVSIAGYERRLAEKDHAFAEQTKNLERAKHSLKALQAEVELLTDTLQQESLESRGIESKLRDVGAMKTQTELLSREISGLYNQLMVTNAQRHKYNALFVRMDAIFGSSSFYLEESKAVNTEIAFASTLSTGFEACRHLAAVVSIATSGRVAIELQERCRSSADMFVALYLLMLQAQYFAVQSNVTLFRDADFHSSNAAQSQSRLQVLMGLKAVFERVAHLSVKVEELFRLAAAPSAVVLDVTVDDDDDAGGASEGRDEVDALISQSAAEASQQAVAFGELARALASALEELRAIAFQQQQHESGDGEEGLSERQLALFHRDVQLFSVEPSANSCDVPVAQAELSFMSLNALCDLALLLSVSQQSVGSTTANSPSLQEQLRSLKIEAKTGIFQLKQNAPHYSQYLSELADCCHLMEADTLLGGDAANRDAQSAVKSALGSLRAMNNAVASTQQATGQHVTVGVTAVTRYFPLVLMTNISPGAAPQQRLSEDALLKDQFSQHVERFWNLLIQSGGSDLLAGAVASTPAAATPASSKSTFSFESASTDLAGSSGEVSWKSRVAELRKIVSHRLGTAPGTTGPAGTMGGGRAEDAMSSGQQQFVSAAKHAAVLHELDEKRDELRSALRKCQELQEIQEAAVRASAGAQTEELARLRDEVNTLQAALEATERKADAQLQEAKRSGALSPGPKTESRPTGRRSSMSSAPHSQSAFHLTGAGASSAATMSAANTLSSGAVDQYEQMNQFLRDQNRHWRRVATRRLTQSLLPLPDLTAPRAQTPADSASRPGLPLDYEPGNTVKQPNVFQTKGGKIAEHIVGFEDGAASAEDYRQLYRKIRLIRASSARIAPIAGVSCAEAKSASGSGEGGLSKAELLRNRVKSRANLIYRIPPAAQ